VCGRGRAARGCGAGGDEERWPAAAWLGELGAAGWGVGGGAGWELAVARRMQLGLDRHPGRNS
jgi:hypothetical protein